MKSREAVRLDGMGVFSAVEVDVMLGSWPSIGF
jgi:hypothetical protein